MPVGSVPAQLRICLDLIADMLVVAVVYARLCPRKFGGSPGAKIAHVY
jgi:hypothetical protein